MSVITDTWRQLVRRRLWPVALLLVAALAAVPVLLADEPAPVAATAPAPQANAGEVDEAATGEPIVALAGAEDRSRRRRVLGARKNPFQPVVVPTPEPAATPSPSTPNGPSPQTGGSPAPSGGSGGAPAYPISPAPSTPVAPTVPVAPQEPKKTYPVNSLIVRFGDAVSGDLERMNLERLEPLPSPEEPVLVYLGLTKDRRSAIFMVDAAAEVTGDGRCQPHPSNCETIELSKGETEFFDVTDDETGAVVAQYQLDLVDIKARKASADEARAAYAKESRKGRRALKARVAQRGPLHWDYDRDTGTLRPLDRKAYTAKVARVEGVLAPTS